MSGDLCYAIHGSSPSQISIDLPCGVPNASHPHVTCCVNGDYCLSNSLCAHTRPDGSQGFYNADCTDPTLEDPACGTRCGGRGSSDLVYNETTGYWACCWNSATKKIDCDNPSNEIYPAPAPSELTTIQYLPEFGSGTPTYATARATAYTTAAEADHSSANGLSPGTAAGIGVGVGIGIILLAASAFFIYFQKRVNKRRGHILPLEVSSAGHKQQTAHPRIELKPEVYEMENQVPRHELDTISRSVERAS